MQTDFSTAHVTHSSVQGWIITGFDFEIEYADGPVRAPGMVGPFASCGEAEATLCRLRNGEPIPQSDDEDEPDDSYPPACTNPGGHEFECTGTQYGGDDERWHGEGRCLCVHCGADGDA